MWQFASRERSAKASISSEQDHAPFPPLPLPSKRKADLYLVTGACNHDVSHNTVSQQVTVRHSARLTSPVERERGDAVDGSEGRRGERGLIDL